MRLNDWGVYLLVEKFSKKLFSNPDDAKLMSWFVFNKLGYDVRVGLAKKQVTLMFYSKKIIYSTLNYNFSNKKFYVLSHYDKSRVGRLYSYKQSYPEATKAFDLSLKELPKFNRSAKSKSLWFKSKGEVFTTTYNYNQNLIDFMATYPEADCDRRNTESHISKTHVLVGPERSRPFSRFRHSFDPHRQRLGDRRDTLDDPHNTCSGDAADTYQSHVIFEDLVYRHLRNRNGPGRNDTRKVHPYVTNERNENEV